MQTILDSRPKGVPMNEAIDMYVKNGWTIEGVNEPKTKTETAKDVAVGFGKGVARTVVNTATGVQDIGQGILGGAESVVTGKELSQTKAMQPNVGVDVLKSETPQGQALQQSITPTNADQKLGGQLEFGAEILAGGGASIIKGGVVGGAKILSKAVKPATNVLAKGTGAVKTAVDDVFFNPVTEEATLTNLNPFIAKVADVSIPVKDEKGIVTYVVKNAKDATENEIQAYKQEAGNLYSKFTEQGKKFLKDRSVEGGSPVEQVGSTIDKYTKQVDTLRKTVGKKMGEIEDKALSLKVDASQLPNVKEFMDVVNQSRLGNIAKYGPDESFTKTANKLYKDIITLESRGANVGESLSLTRKWARYIENQKDKFGDFKDNKFENSTIEKVVNEMKNNARDTLSGVDGNYKALVGQYRKTSQFKDEAKRLLGQEGLYGSSIKGAATAKRAIQSNSDAGARQFLKTLRDITGYDGMKEADIALKAMKDVGDYQGLSLLGILQDAEGGLMGAVKGIAKKLTPSEATRTNKYIKKDK